MARKTFGLSHVVSIREHRVRVDAARADGGEDSAPSPEELLAASLASCAAMTIEMYARRKGWELANVEVEVEYALAKRGAPTKYIVTLALPTGLSDEEIARVRRVACAARQLRSENAIYSLSRWDVCLSGRNVCSSGSPKKARAFVVA